MSTLPGAAFEGFFLCWMQQNARRIARVAPWAQILQDQAKSKRPASPDKAEEWIMKQKAKRAAVFFVFLLLLAFGFCRRLAFSLLLAF